MSITMMEEIERALTRPDSFAYGGDLDLFNTWGLCGPARSRDSDPLEQSNFDVIWKDMNDNFPSDVEIVHSSHWLVGWTDQIAVRVTDDEGAPTEAFEAILGWRNQLEDYAVADEEDYSRREHEDFMDTLMNCYYPRDSIKDSKGNEWTCTIEDTPIEYDEVARMLFDDYSICRSDELSEDTVNEVFIQLGFYEVSK